MQQGFASSVIPVPLNTTHSITASDIAPPQHVAEYYAPKDAMNNHVRATTGGIINHLIESLPDSRARGWFKE